MKKILIVDDDVDMCVLLNIFLTRKGYKTTAVNSYEQAFEHLEYHQPDLIICDVMLGETDGITLLKNVKEKFSEIPFIFITAYDDLKTSVSAMKLGAFDYVIKPLLPEEIAAIIVRAFESKKFNSIGSGTGGKGGQSPVFYYGNTISFNKLHKQINLIANTTYSVIIQGESGSGKEAIAREIHHQSGRKNMPFILLNGHDFAADLSNAVVVTQSETPENRDIFEVIDAANNGTLFINEVAGLSLSVQARLLAAINSRKYSRPITGEDADLNVRFITASGENLWQLAHNGQLLEEIYYKLSDFTIDVLPLRDRKEDIMLFAHYFLQVVNEASGTAVKGFSPDVENIFKNYHWHDNLRELKNVISKAALVSKSEIIDSESLPSEIKLTGKVLHTSL